MAGNKGTFGHSPFRRSKILSLRYQQLPEDGQATAVHEN
jgi:hypothetical protein